MENSAYLALPLFAGLAARDIPAALAALDRAFVRETS